MCAKITTEFSPSPFQDDSEKIPVVGFDAALRYLTSPTSALTRDKIEGLAKDLETHQNISPEVKYYTGWAFLDAAYPGLFSLKESPSDSIDADSHRLASAGFNYFQQLDSRTKYFSKNTPVQELVNKEIQLDDVLYGIKARLVRSFEEFFLNSPSGNSPISIANSRLKMARVVADKLTATGLQIREQIQITEQLLNLKHKLHTEKSIHSFYANLRGIEAECAFLGAIWAAIAKGSSANGLRHLALPASVRTDYGLTSKEPKGDVVFYDGDNKYAVEIARGKVFNAKNGRNYTSNGKTIHLYGDRDLRLPSSQKQGDKYFISPDFKGYKDEADLVMHQVLSTINRLRSESIKE